MLSIQNIKKAYSKNLQSFPRNILREYFQYKILESIFTSGYAQKLCFLGGTALRIIHDNTRFSEDLDFDNFELTKEDFEKLSGKIKKDLCSEGYEIETRIVYKGAFRCYIKIPKVLFDNDLARQDREKLMVQVDTAPHHFSYKKERVFLNKFDVFTEIFVTPIDILLSQKIRTIFERTRAKGRDFFDTIFLLGKTFPNYQYLSEKMGIADDSMLRTKILKKCAEIDFKELSKDVEPFLFSSTDSKKVELFPEFIKSVKLRK